MSRLLSPLFGSTRRALSENTLGAAGKSLSLSPSSSTYSTASTGSDSTSATATSNTGPAAERKRFYKHVSIHPTSPLSTQHIVKLDSRQLKTPMKTLLVLPNKLLAIGVAGEWDAQRPTIKPHLMPLTTLASTSTDIHRNRTRKVRVEDLLRFLSTDTVCCRSPDPAEFVDMQNKHWDPLVSWFSSKYQVTLDVTENLFGCNHPAETIAKLEQHLLSMDEWTFTGLESAVLSSKSFIIGFAVGHGVVDPEQATFCSLLEEEFQTQRWGRVEWGHGLRGADIKMSLAASALFMQLASPSSEFAQR